MAKKSLLPMIAEASMLVRSALKLVESARQTRWAACWIVFLAVECFAVGSAGAQTQRLAGLNVGKLDRPSAQAFWMFKQGQVGPTTDLSGLTYATKPPAGDYDWSGIVVHQAGEGARPAANLGGFTMVTRRHGVGAKHAQDAGPVNFVGRDNSVVVRNVVEKQAIADTDIEVITLDEDVPETVKVYRVMTDLRNLDGHDVYSVRHNRRVFTRTLKSPDDRRVRHTASAQGESVKSSGKPMLVAADGELFLLCVHYTAHSSFAIAGYVDEIDAIVRSAGDYRLTTVPAPAH